MTTSMRPPQPDTSPPSSRGGPHRGPLRILIAAEHALLAQGLSVLLRERQGVTVRVARGDEPLDQLERDWQPNLIIVECSDVVKLDPSSTPFPRSTGAPPVLVIAPDDDEQIRAALRGGARGFVPRD
ncbi:MAG TPA: hypothetical protein VH916_02945, partial [Dehalococcoidia bacterium]